MPHDDVFRAPRTVDLGGVDHALITGTFTPVVGAACSTLECPAEPREMLAGDVQRKLMALATHIQGTNEEDREADLEHLRQLADINTGLAENPPPGFLAPEMAALLHALLRVDRFACTFFQVTQPPIGSGDRISLWKTRDDRRVRLPRHAEEWEVPFADHPEAAAFQHSLDDAIVAAERAQDESIRRDQYADDLHANRGWKDLGLGAAGIATQLTGFRRLLFGEKGHGSGQRALTLPDLIWLGSVLWHVLRFDLPYYPTTPELAFQMALQAQAGISYDRELPSLAQAAQTVPDPLKHITNWFTFYDTNKTASRLYNTLAQWLLMTFERHRVAAAVRRLAPPAPVILTTNYDRAIENALDAKGSPYHVLIPVLHKRWRRGQERDQAIEHHVPIWLLKTKYRNPQDKKKCIVDWSFGGCTNVRHQRGDNESANLRDTLPVLQGPLVVKLHGSPLDDLPDKRIDNLPERLRHVDDDFEYEHRIVISESDYLRDIRDDIPDQIKGFLSEGKRILVFLGQSIADWNIRLRLADHVAWSTPADGEDLPPPPERFAINKRARRFDTGIMGRLRIDVIKEDLRAVPALIQQRTT